MNTTAKGTTAAVLLIVPVVAELVSEPLGDGTALQGHLRREPARRVAAPGRRVP